MTMLDLINEMYPQLSDRIKQEMSTMAEAQVENEKKEEPINTLVPMMLNLIVKLHELNPDLMFVTKKSDMIKNVMVSITPIDLHELAVVIGKDKAIMEIESLLMEQVVTEMDKEIKETNANKLIADHLLQSVQTIQEAGFAPKLGLKLRYHLI